MTEDQIQLVAKELDGILNKFDLILRIAPDEWARCEVLFERLTKLDAIFGLIARFGKNLKTIGVFLEQLQKDFPDVEEIMKLELKCRKYIYGLTNVELPKEKDK